jgi:hypothetical protein
MRIQLSISTYENPNGFYEVMMNGNFTHIIRNSFGYLPKSETTKSVWTISHRIRTRRRFLKPDDKRLIYETDNVSFYTAVSYCISDYLSGKWEEIEKEINDEADTKELLEA